MKIVLNRCHGGFDLSHEGVMRYAELKGLRLEFRDKHGLREYKNMDTQEEFIVWKIQRDDPVLVHVVEELGEKVNTRFSSLEVVEFGFEIRGYGGVEDPFDVEFYQVWRE